MVLQNTFGNSLRLESKDLNIEILFALIRIIFNYRIK